MEKFVSVFNYMSEKKKQCLITCLRKKNTSEIDLEF